MGGLPSKLAVVASTHELALVILRSRLCILGISPESSGEYVLEGFSGKALVFEILQRMMNS